MTAEVKTVLLTAAGVALAGSILYLLRDNEYVEKITEGFSG